MSADNAPIVLIGPGGVGKGTIAKTLTERRPEIALSKSWTTRPVRPGETGEEYVFVSREEFERAIVEGVFLEWAEFHGNLYGSPRPTTSDRRVLYEIEIQGAAQILELVPDALVILLEPPSMDELEGRLRRRGDDDDHVRRRLGSTEHELAVGRTLAGHIVTNDDLERAIGQILSILDGPRSLSDATKEPQ